MLGKNCSSVGSDAVRAAQPFERLLFLALLELAVVPYRVLAMEARQQVARLGVGVRCALVAGSFDELAGQPLGDEQLGLRIGVDEPRCAGERRPRVKPLPMRGQLASDVMIVRISRLDDVVDAVFVLQLQHSRAHQSPGDP